MSARMSYLTSATSTPCARTLKVSTSAAVSEVTRETAGFALVSSSQYTMYITCMLPVQTLYHAMCYVPGASHTQEKNCNETELVLPRY